MAYCLWCLWVHPFQICLYLRQNSWYAALLWLLAGTCKCFVFCGLWRAGTVALLLATGLVLGAYGFFVVAIPEVCVSPAVISCLT